MPIRLIEVAAASIATPPSGMATLFMDIATGEPAYKDDLGNVIPLFSSSDPELAAIAALVSAANSIPMFSGSGTATLLLRDTDTTLAADSDTRLATQKAVKAYVTAQILALINAAPGALDTLDELAAALGDDAAFATTVTNALAGKQPSDADLTAIAALVRTRGDLIVGGASDWIRLAKGTAGQRLRMADANDPGWTDDFYTIPFMIDGGGAVITTGFKGVVQADIAGSIVAATVLAADNLTGSIVIDLWKDSYANHPPTVADTITAAAKPTISADVKATDSTLTGWTTAIAAGDVLGFNVDSVSTFTRVLMSLKVKKS